METLEKKGIFLQTMLLFPFSASPVHVVFVVVSCLASQVCTNKLTCLLKNFCQKKIFELLPLLYYSFLQKLIKPAAADW